MKQADVVLLGFPLMHPMHPEVRRNDLVMYEPVTELSGPAMTWVRGAHPQHGPSYLSHSITVGADPLCSLLQSMFAVGWLELKETQRAQGLLNKCFSNITEPFKVSCFPVASASWFCLVCSPAGPVSLRALAVPWLLGYCIELGGCSLHLLCMLPKGCQEPSSSSQAAQSQSLLSWSSQAALRLWEVQKGWGYGTWRPIRAQLPPHSMTSSRI